jgi:hypothetical protein
MPPKTPEAIQREMTVTRPGRSQPANLRDQVVDNWATPRSGKVTSEDPEVWKGRKAKGGVSTMPLTMQAQTWPTPASRDSKGANGAAHLEAGTGRKHMDQLPNFVEHSFHLPQTTPTDGEKPSPSPRRLNPLFVEWLMGWPIGWSGCGSVGTASFRLWRQRHLFALRQNLELEINNA